MTDDKPQDPRARGQAIRAARLSRTRMIRRRIISGAVALFVASWLLITIVLVSGHDPALAKQSSASTVASSSSPATTTSTTSTTTSGSSSGNSGSGTVSSVTTSQS
jgi:hypothetical protein